MKKYVLPIVLFSVFLHAQSDSLSKSAHIDEIVITGTMKSVRKDKSPVPVEIYSQRFFQKNPTPSLIESVGMINGVRPQINCSVCNTGDIHINGLEGPYTMILIDGMPIVSALSTVYGLSGIPNSMIDRVEVVKGPASSLYGSEAMGGIINVITKNALTAPKFTADLSTSTWAENNLDLGMKYKMGNKASALLSLSYYHFNERKDLNDDNFTDATLQKRISVFNKYNFKRPHHKQASFALRYMYEDRFGGEMQYKPEHRGGEDVYGESIYTNRAEVIGSYQLPTTENIFAQFSYNYHHQDSYYGTTSYLATQNIGFGQLYWNRLFGKNDLLIGASVKYSGYDDNTPGTLSADGLVNQPSKDWTPGFFVQDEIAFNDQNTLLIGYRLDHSKNHGFINSPRLAYKFSPTETVNWRLSFGTGFRVVNLFTEDHAALTGSREVVIKNELQPERSYNGNLNFTKKVVMDSGYINFDATAFYTYFTNKILGDFETDPNKIIYDNLSGYAISSGLSLNTEIQFPFPLTANIGGTYMEVYSKYEDTKEQQLLAPKWSGKYALTYHFTNKFFADLTGELYGPMKLPVVPNDFRPEWSPWYHIMNLQARKEFKNNFELYAGVKNLLNFTPKDPLLRPFDPFDKDVNNPNNPYGYTFDTTYGYAPMLGIRGYLGVKYTIR